MSRQSAYQRALTLAAVTGLRSSWGPALWAIAKGKPQGKILIAAALGEMVMDKLPIVPSRDSLVGMVPRMAAGAYVTKSVLEDEGIDDPWAIPMGAAVAAGVAFLAPKIRGLLSRGLHLPDPIVGLAEDALAARAGTFAAGLSAGDVKQTARESFAEARDRARRLQPASAGSM